MLLDIGMSFFNAFTCLVIIFLILPYLLKNIKKMLTIKLRKILESILQGI
jgi:hypothetical protein